MDTRFGEGGGTVSGDFWWETPDDAPPYPTNWEPLTVKKFAASVPVSCCVMTDATGTNHCEHPSPPPIRRWRRMRWDLRNWWDAHRPHVHLGPCNTEDDW